MFQAVIEKWFIRKAIPCARCAPSGHAALRRFVTVNGRPAVACFGCADFSKAADSYSAAVENWNEENRPILRGYDTVTPKFRIPRQA